jgi:vitamin B12 transporter
MVWFFILFQGLFSTEPIIFSGNNSENSVHAVVLKGREYPLEGDTLLLHEIEVFSHSLSKYSFGQDVKVIPSEVLLDFQGFGLSDFLQQRTGLFVRQYGAGMLASLTLRGTSSGHNAVFWNGLPINSPSLGQTDFSILPIGGFDELQLHLGSGGALYGTDAIGGAVHLNSKLMFGQGHSFQLGTQLGSFRRWNQQVQYGYSSKIISLRTKVYRNVAENDFPYQNLSKPGTPVEKQEHASFHQLGASQDVAFKISSNQLLSSSFWYNQTEREIQPVIGSNTYDEQKDRNLRWVMDYFMFSKSKTWNFKTGSVIDQIEFNGIQNSTVQLFLIGDLDWEISPNLSSKSGIRHTRILGRLSTYAVEEDRIELYQGTNLHLNEDLHLSVNLRQFIYDGNLAPFTPSLGTEWVILSNELQEFKLNSNGARSFKVPTLNDRFWEPGGNQDLVPESSWSAELGISHLWRKGGLMMNQKLTYYQMWVDNWIIWLPQGNIWAPENIREVHNKGLEYFFDADYKMKTWTLEIQGNYNWIRAINQSNITDNDRSSGNQLPYTPVHKFQTLFGIKRGIWNPYINYQFTGSRFVGTDNQDTLPSFQLWDWGIRMGEIKNTWFKGNIGFQVNNLMNTAYQVMRLRAMPGRNYQINIQIKL